MPPIYQKNLQKGKITNSKVDLVKRNSDLDIPHPNFSENAHAFCSNTSLHGLKFIGDRRITYLERFFFVISFVLAFLVNIYFISNVYEKWTSRPIIVGISPKITYIQDIPFPAITICNMNQALASKVKDITNGSYEYSILQTLCSRDIDLKSEALNTTNSYQRFKKFLMESSQPCTKMIIYCRVTGELVPCKNTFHPILTDEGLCCTFNSLKSDYMYANISSEHRLLISEFLPLGIGINWTAETGYPNNLPAKYYPVRTGGTGTRMGVTLIMDAQTPEYYCSSTNGAGFKVLLHNPSEIPKISDFGFSINVGHETRVIVNPQKSDTSKIVRNVRKIYRKCLFDDEANLTFFGTYSRVNCEMECEAKRMAQECDCIEYYLPKVANVPICGLKDIECSDRIGRRSALNNTGDCSDQCLPACFELSYIPDSFSTPFANYGFPLRGKILSSMDRTYVQKNMAIVQIYYTQNAFRSYQKEQFIGFTEFLSNTGGLLGLFLGFSVIFVIEIIYYMSMRPWFATRRFKKHEQEKIIEARNAAENLLQKRVILKRAHTNMNRNPFKNSYQRDTMHLHLNPNRIPFYN